MTLKIESASDVSMAAGLATAFIGLALALPLIGYASWHAYKEIVADD